ncbi:hypothetical protein SAMN05421766_101322 [Zobellia uliginosa]|uniref:Group-specific protein n=1 Tax=Zobellia uliginosa TaxID=143224 RepID=A0ABY1KIF8_9FLAO|nr:hypothetical protein [Zobellia uliginosa]SIS38725.1 hypothetical protein SAMN05421766_101322 [Zobellia uliginosa]
MITIVFLMIGPPIIFLILAIVGLASKNKKMAKIFFILTGVYLLISFGTCGIMLSNFSLDTK